ncbi:Uncharacterised protein [Mycobacteroides abscessus subsp. abscessus]|nr:Uncharacterised protein [Mycobacteroides abscessus subsp. abscessus]
MVQVDSRSRCEVSIDHPTCLVVEHRRSRESSAEDFDRCGGLHPAGLEVDECLGECGDIGGHDQLIGRFDQLSTAAWSHVYDGRTDSMQEGRRCLERLV